MLSSHLKYLILRGQFGSKPSNEIVLFFLLAEVDLFQLL